MGIGYGPTPLFLDHFNGSSLDSSKWATFGDSYGTIAVNNSICTITNTNVAYNWNGIYSLKTFGVGTIITVKSKNTSGRHASLIGFGESPWWAYPHAMSSGSAFTWYSRADAHTSTISWRSENGTTGSYSSATQNLTGDQVFKLVRVSSSVVEVYRNDVLEYTATGLVFANNHHLYFSLDGHTTPDVVEIDYITVTKVAL